MYYSAKLLYSRIEVAIQRFLSKRTLHETYARVFSRWMNYGGIDTVQRQFSGGISKEELEGRDAAEKARLLATFEIGDDKDPDFGRWEVDFMGVLKGFL